MAKGGWKYGEPDWSKGYYKGYGDWGKGYYKGYGDYPTVTPWGDLPYDYTPLEEKGLSQYQQWQPYLAGLGILPQSGGYLTATSPALRGRMLPGALEAMQNYYALSPARSWADYIDWSQMFMPRTPTMWGRSWMPAWSR